MYAIRSYYVQGGEPDAETDHGPQGGRQVREKGGREGGGGDMPGEGGEAVQGERDAGLDEGGGAHRSYNFV